VETLRRRTSQQKRAKAPGEKAKPNLTGARRRVILGCGKGPRVEPEVLQGGDGDETHRQRMENDENGYCLHEYALTAVLICDG